MACSCTFAMYIGKFCMCKLCVIKVKENEGEMEVCEGERVNLTK